MRGWDIIYYGTDLLDYIDQEFKKPRPERPDDWNPQSGTSLGGGVVIGIRLRILATSLDEARSRVIGQYGEGHVISIWNEEDASCAR
ncbi:hypothetical protein ACFYON_04880 [Micromonospora sp. NPDC005686]|uniref:hypothetical protein n=1 Tax=unclassified Micromonospora TaxID=2617518 RepID=UPI0033A443E7